MLARLRVRIVVFPRCTRAPEEFGLWPASVQGAPATATEASAARAVPAANKSQMPFRRR